MVLSKYKIQLMAALTGANIAASGGVCYVAQAGDAAKATLYNADGSALSNPVALNRGNILFCTSSTVASVDLYIMTPGGQFIVQQGVVASGPSEIAVDTSNRMQVAVIPFAIGDTTATTETDTGFDLPTDALVLPHGIAVDVLTADSTETVDVGILASESGGDANGFAALLSVGTVGTVPATATVTTGSNTKFFASTTLGALVADFQAGTDVDQDEGLHAPKVHRCDGTAKSISYTLTAGTDTAEGFILLPYLLGGVA